MKREKTIWIGPPTVSSDCATSDMCPPFEVPNIARRGVLPRDGSSLQLERRVRRHFAEFLAERLLRWPRGHGAGIRQSFGLGLHVRFLRRVSGLFWHRRRPARRWNFESRSARLDERELFDVHAGQRRAPGLGGGR